MKIAAKPVLIAVFSILLPSFIQAQPKSPFTGDAEKFSAELTTFMGPNLNEAQKANLASFIVKWDSAAFSPENMMRIIDICSQFAGRSMRPVPHFNDFIATLNIFISEERDQQLLSDWMSGLSELVFNPRFTADNIGRYVRIIGQTIRENILAESSAITWKAKGGKLEFVHDTVFYIKVTGSTLVCYSQRDSTEIINATGSYFPEYQQFHGETGRVTWEKAGYEPAEVFAEISNYIINTARNNFSVDSALLTHKTYFREPVMGSLTDQTISVSNKERATFPKFETYIKEFKLPEIYEGVDYEGGLTFEGATVKGTGSDVRPAKVSLSRNDTLYMKVASSEFIFAKTGLTGAEASMALYLEKDSIYHSNLSFSYNNELRQVNLFRGNNPISKSPYFNSFHNVDMYFEYLSWNLKESKIVMSRARGASLGQAQFESESYFDLDYFMRLAGIDNVHPLVRLKRFAEWYYSETFPVEDFAKWLNKPLEAVTALCIEMANRGFLFYDRKFNEVTLKKKVDDHLAALNKKQDYDVLNIMSETKAPVDNAILDLKNFRLTINGVNGVRLSKSQNVTLYPYNYRLVMGKNRSIEFDGVVEAGLFTIFGHSFSFSYDTFKIRLQKIDSIRIAVETAERDAYGNPVIKPVDNLIQLGTAELYIDMPNNKSGLRKLEQYPIINAVTFSYIFFDKIPGLEGIYPPEDFYFKIDPFTYENIDHYTNEDMNLAGEFIGGNILKPMRQTLTIQEDNSLGFNMIIPDAGVEVYDSRGTMYDNLSMSGEGLVGSGILKHLTSTTRAEEFRFFPDSMITRAQTFDIEKDDRGVFPELESENVSIKWLPGKDEWLAENSPGKNFMMFGNGTNLNGSLKLTPSVLTGAGMLGTSDSRVNSDRFSFASSLIKADTSNYNLRSSSTEGDAFIAENVNTEINFDLKRADFHLNTDTSMVKFPEIQYLCTMTNFSYNMDTRILSMEQKGKSDSELLSPENLLKLDFNALDKPTFFATNVIGDTIKFSSWKGTYNLSEEIIQAENINYIHIADALIQPDKGKVTIERRARIRQLENAVVAVNKRHLLHTARINIASTKSYSGSAIYDYIDENKEVQQISFPEVRVDTMATSAKGYIAATQKFMLSPAFSYTGDVSLFAAKDHLSFTGAAGIAHNCSQIKSYPVKFRSLIDPLNIMIPLGEKPRDINDNLIFSGSFLNIDSIHIYPAFLSAQKSWTDANLVNAGGYLYYEKSTGRYLISSIAKIIDQTLHGELTSFDKNYCILAGEGKMNFGTNFDLVRMTSAGTVRHNIDSAKVDIKTILALDFHFSAEALQIMSDEIRMMPTLKPVNLNSNFNKKGMKDLLGEQAALQIQDELNLFGTSRNLPKEFNFELLLNEVTLYWNDASSSFRSKGKIGIGFVGPQPINVYVDGYIEIQRRRTGDMIDIYLKVDESTWYYFSYIRGNMMVQAGNNAFNSLIANIKQNDRKHPDSSVRTPYTYMISVEDRLARFLRRMEGTEDAPADQALPPGITR
jgi:hypothetical protein